jgi:glycosyltransferase involved in cell wall biosynthesis
MHTNLTVVVPCYNCAKTIENAFQSIIDQTRKPNQIILINDCSSDETSFVLKKLAITSNIETIIIELPCNQGPAYARNIGIDRSENNLIAFLDSDDTWHPLKLEIQIEIMEDNPDCALSGHIIKYKNSITQRPLKKVSSVREISFRQLLFKNYFNTPSVVIRRSNLRFPSDFRFSEDYFFWLSIASEGGKLLYINQTLGFVHKPFYGHSGLSAFLKSMHKSEIIALSRFKNNIFPDSGYISAAIFFAKFKYLLRIIKTKMRR